MGKFYSALLDAVKQRLLKSSCSKVTKMTKFTKAVDVFHKFFTKLLARNWHFAWCCKLLEQRKCDQSSCHSSVHSLQLTSCSARQRGVSAVLATCFVRKSVCSGSYVRNGDSSFEERLNIRSALYTNIRGCIHILGCLSPPPPPNKIGRAHV